MKYISLNNDSIQTSQLVLGCMRMAEKSYTEVQEVIQTAYDNGINMFDHADIYGGGKSEEIFAAAIQQTSIQRQDIILQSKVGIRKGFYDFSKEHIIQSVEGVLSRLNTDYLDILLLHRPDTLMEPEEVAEAFDQLYQTGKVKAFGVSNQNVGQMRLLQKYVHQPLKINQLQFGPAHTGIIDQGLNVNMKDLHAIDYDSGLLEYCRYEGITIQPWSPFQVDLSQGLFSKHLDYKDLVGKINEYAEMKNSTFEGIVIAWLLRHPANFQPILGSMNPERIKKMIQGTQVNLTREEWYDIYQSAGNPLP